MATADQTADRLAIADTLHRYAEAMDILGANPVSGDMPDPALGRATEVMRSCMTEDGLVRLYFQGPGSDAITAGDGGPASFAKFVRQYFTDYGYVQTYHLVGNVRVDFTGPDSANVRSYINSTHWMADGRFLFAPIEYRDKVVRLGDAWYLAERDIDVWRWWVTDGYAPVPTDPTLARPI